MKWVRANIKQGSRLALLALAIQVVLTFGHFHAISAQASPAIYAASALDRAPPQPSSDHDSDQSHDVCAICAVMALASAALSASAPLLPTPQAAKFSFLSSDAEFVRCDSARATCQPRAPPAS